MNLVERNVHFCALLREKSRKNARRAYQHACAFFSNFHAKSRQNWTFSFSQLFVMICIAMLLTSCQQKKNNDPRAEVMRLVARIEAASQVDRSQKLVKALTTESVTYDVSNLRDPFAPPTMVRNTKQYPNSILKDVSLDSLELIGVVMQKESNWAIFKAKNGQLYKMTEGARVGFQQALLTQIKVDSVTFTIDANEEFGEKPRDVVFPVQESGHD